MAKIQGRLGALAVSSDGGVNWDTVAGAQDLTFNGNADTIDVSSHDSGQFREFLQGRKDATLDGSLFWDEADPGQGIIKNAYFSSTRIDVRFRMQEATGKDEIFAKAVVTTFGESSPNDDGAAVDVTLQITGDFTPSTQP
jgi:TP901-1 family phage major tail protein